MPAAPCSCGCASPTTRARRARTLADPAAAPEPILAAGRALLGGALPAIERRGLTLLGVTVANLADLSGGEQLALPVPAPAPAPRIQPEARAGCCA